MIEDRDYTLLYWCSGLTRERWREECRLVEERFSLFRAFGEVPFFGFREDGKLCVDVSWNPGTFMFADVIGAAIVHVEAVQGASSGTECA